ncbi:LamG domain-containing protein [Candidatus Omnitrophota bacterium]
MKGIARPVIITAFIVFAAWVAANTAHADTVAYWRFEDGTFGEQMSDPIEDTVGDHDLDVFQGGIYPSYSDSLPAEADPKVPQTGADNTLSAYIMDIGTDNYLRSDTLGVTSNQVTIEFWVAALSSPGSPSDIFASYSDDATDTSAMSFYGGGQHNVTFDLYINSIEYSITSDTALTQGEWYHIAGTWDNEYMRIYVDGNLDKQSEILASGSVDLDDAYVGYDPYGNLGGLLRIDEVRISDTALSPDKFLYSSGGASATPEPGTMVLYGSGMVSMFVSWWRKRRKKRKGVLGKGWMKRS